MEASEDHLHVVPDVQGAEPRVRLSEGHKLILLELVGLHGHRVEGEGLVDGKVCKETRSSTVTSPGVLLQRPLLQNETRRNLR